MLNENFRNRSHSVTLANKITIVRIVLIPVIVIGLLQLRPFWPDALFIFCALTDVLDGFIARRRGEKSVVGAFLDPVADKLLLVSVYLTLAHIKQLPIWVFVVVFSRDLLIFLGWNILYTLTQDARLTPRVLGRITTILQLVTVVVLLVYPLRPLYPFFLWTMVAFTAASTIDYVWVGARRLNALSQ
jgi:cardiolipin synthase (CMP-forming)